MKFPAIAGVVAITTILPASPATATGSSCLDAWQSPKSQTAQTCRDHGWTVRQRLIVGPKHWVRFTHLPHCLSEDSPGPCLWVGPEDGNGIGRSFWTDGRIQVHYVKGIR